MMMRYYRRRLCVCLFVVATLICFDLLFGVVNNKADLHVSRTESSRKPLSPHEIGPSTEARLYRSMEFTRMKFGPAFIMSSVVTNSSSSSRLDFIHVYASMHDAVLRYTIVSCCLKLKGNSTIIYNYFKVPVTVIRSPLPKQRLSSYFYACPNAKPGIIPEGVGITVDSFNCSEDNVVYIQPMVPQKQNSGVTMALCNKGAFGRLSPELIIEWMETYRYLGVDKVSTYFVDELNEAAKKVLFYYSSIGFVDLYKFQPANEDLMPRKYRTENAQFLSDRQIAVFDCHDRMSGYTYYGIMDHDEFLIPSGDMSLKEFLADLYKTYPNAAAFTFRAEYYFLPFGAYGTTNDLIIGKFITRTERQFQNLRPRKTIYKPVYIQPGGAHTHDPKPVNGKHRVVTSYAEGFFRHFRSSCYTWGCSKEREHNIQNDTWLSEWSTNIEQSVRFVRKAVFNTENMVHPS